MTRTTIRSEDITNSEVTTAKMAVDPTNASNLSSGSVPTAQLGNVDTTSLETDIALLGFKVAANGSMAAYNLKDQTVDAFEDDSGVDTSSSTNERVSEGYVSGAVGAGTYTAQNPSGNTNTNQGGYSTSLTTQTHSNSSTWDTADGQSHSGKYYNNDYSSAKKMRRMHFRMTGGNNITYRIRGSSDRSTWTTVLDVDVAESASAASGGTGLVKTFSNDTEYRYWEVIIDSATQNTTASDIGYLEFATENISISDLTLVSNSTTAESTPTTGDIVMTYTNGAGTATVNTDLKAWISRDNGTTYTQATLSSEGTTGGHTILTAHNVDISSQPSGTSMRYKITTHNQSASKETRIQAVSLGWA